MRSIRFICLGVLLQGCSPESTPPIKTETATSTGKSLPASYYFPPYLMEPTVPCDFGNGVRKLAVISEIEADWYPEHLSAAGEPSVYRMASTVGTSGDRTLRFTWLRTFDAPVFVRVEHRAGTSRLVAKQLSGAGRYKPGTVVRTVERMLSPDEVVKLERVVSGASLTSMAPADCPGGTDGSQWIIETADQQGYRFVQRWSPENGPLRDLGLALLKLSGWNFKDIY